MSFRGIHKRSKVIEYIFVILVKSLGFRYLENKYTEIRFPLICALQ